MITFYLVLAGGAGAVSRFALDGVLRGWRSSSFPWPTLPWPTILINVTGSLALGLLSGWVIYRGGASDWKLVLGTGFCGGYTTFSTASFETVRLAQRGEARAAIGNALGTAVLTVGAAAIGLVAMR